MASSRRHTARSEIRNPVNTPLLLPLRQGRRFRNPNPDMVENSFGTVARWLLQETLSGRGFPSFGILSTGEGRKPAEAKANPCLLRENSGQTTLTWFGHSSFLIQVAGVNLLTDPVWSRRVFPAVGPRRFLDPGIPLQQLPPIHQILISHNHYDHLDLATLRRLGPSTELLVPLGLKSLLARKGFRKVRELSWWDIVRAGKIELQCVPAQHFSVRGPGNRDSSLWSGWVVAGTRHRFYFAGDTGFFEKQFRQIASQCGPLDVAILPIGAYRPQWLMRPVHMSPSEALEAFAILGAGTMVPCHWGTFKLSEEPLDEPLRLLDRERKERKIPADRVWVAYPGKTWVLDP
jgi:N-acyl-phosphatidylethanolamine-hydrolysing phospholipase D